MANEFDRHVIATRTRAALEFESYFPGSLDLVDIGNARQFAQRVSEQRGRIMGEEMCGQLRFVHYPARAKAYDTSGLLEIYQEAWGIAGAGVAGVIEAAVAPVFASAAE